MALFLRTITILAALTVAAPASAKAGLFEPETAVLDNGMQVIVVSKTRAPIVTHMVWYKAGSIDEPLGKSGVAHFLEHLMFKGTTNTPSGEFSSTIARNGGNDNAFTSYDYTAYFQNIAADRLELVMQLEADRMTNLILDPAEIETEREVVLEERRTRTDNSPGARLREQAMAAFYLNHPYRRPIIGWESEIRAITQQDLEDFYGRWYAPNNAVLVVVGDVTMEEVLPLAEKTYGVIPARAVEPPPVQLEPEHIIDQEISMRDANVREPSWSKRYLAPSYLYGETEHAYALQVLSEILSGGSTSRLYNALVVEDETASSAGAWYSPSSRGPSSLGFWVAPARDGDLDQAVAAMEAQIALLRDEGVTEDEVSRAIIRLQDSAELAKDSFRGIARLLGAAATIGRDLDEVEAWPERIGSVTAEDVNAAIQAVLVDAGSLSTRLLPLENGDVTPASGDRS
ncbi:MAG: pitrilysin family protein [Alphaproteobacteria bacterium]|nr:pitrilysin family protein [Alphaproteobacteria bacterium]